MSLPPELQAKELIDKSENILVLVPEDASGDAFGAAAGIGAFLENSGKEVSLAGSGIEPIARPFGFLKPPEHILPSISGVREFILSFNTKRNDIVSVRTERGDDEYRIFITPEKGSIDPRDFSFVPAKFSFDLVIAVGAPDKESLGKIFETNPDIFYEVPVITFDHHAENDRFGQVNIVDVTASSTSEIATAVLEKLDGKNIDARVAGLLLAGIVLGTESFQKKNLSPGALGAAARLMDRGADQHDIIFRLVNTQPLSLLKLWGRVMAGLKWDEDLRLMWACVTPDDIVQSRSRLEDLPLILEKIRRHSSSGSIFMILHAESVSRMRAIVKSPSGNLLSEISMKFPESKLRNDMLDIPLSASSIEEAETTLLESLRKAR